MLSVGPPKTVLSHLAFLRWTADLGAAPPSLGSDWAKAELAKLLLVLVFWVFEGE